MTVRSSLVGLGMVVGLVGAVPEWVAAQEQAARVRGGVVLESSDGVVLQAEKMTMTLSKTQPPASEWLGLALEPLSEVLAAQLGLKTGMVVDSVPADGPAQKAGLRRHDILLEANGTPIKASSDLLRAVAGAAAERKPVRLGVLRGGKPLEITVTPEPRPAAVLIRRSRLGGQAGEGPAVVIEPKAEVQGRKARVVLGPAVQMRAEAAQPPTDVNAAAIADLKKSIDELRAEIARLAARGAAKD